MALGPESRKESGWPHRRRHHEEATRRGNSVPVARDYCEGPLPDETQPGEVWVFGKHIEGTEVYIKLKLTNTEAPKCLSFHPAERTLHYPFRNRKMKEGRT